MILWTVLTLLLLVCSLLAPTSTARRTFLVLLAAWLLLSLGLHALGGPILD